MHLEFMFEYDISNFCMFYTYGDEIIVWIIFLFIYWLKIEKSNILVSFVCLLFKYLKHYFLISIFYVK